MINNMYIFMKMQAANIYFSLLFPLMVRGTLENKGEQECTIKIQGSFFLLHCFLLIFRCIGSFALMTIVL